MGSFSFLRADKTTRRNNLTIGDKYKILVPKEYGGGYIKDTYWDYGYVNHYGNAYYVDENRVKYDELEMEADLYGILAYWNMKHSARMKLRMKTGNDNRPLMLQILTDGDTCNQDIRCMGIDIGCYDNQVDNLEYPLKLVSASYKGTYEDCEMRSYGDPNQGFHRTYWED